MTILDQKIVETITFNPSIEVNENVIAGNMVVLTADIIQQDDQTQVVAAIYGDGRVIGVPFQNDNETSLRSALS